MSYEVRAMMAKAVQAPRIDPHERLSGEGGLSDEVAEIFADPDAWMKQKHPMLAGRSPEECIADGDEQAVWDLLRAIKYVGQT